jgi:hypothetical protein
MTKRKGTDQGRHIAALRDRARRPDIKTRKGRANRKRQAIQEGSR